MIQCQRALEDEESRDAPDEALRGLPPREAVVLTMKLVDGRSQKEIAEALEMSEGSVSKLVTRGWARIRENGWEVADGAA